jgi:hypothetical protein
MNHSDIIWMASYPRSGSNWLRNIINFIVSPKSYPRESIPSFSKQFPSGVPVHNLNLGKIRIIKTHFYPENKRMIGFSGKCVGFILIHRHPLDVLLSSINFARCKGQEDYFLNQKIQTVDHIIKKGEIKYYIDKFLEQDGISMFSGLSGKYSEYLETWNNYNKDHRSLIIKYEHLILHPKFIIRNILDFFQMEAHSDRTDAIHKITECPDVIGDALCTQKTAYHFKQLLHENIIDYFYFHYREQLISLGYWSCPYKTGPLSQPKHF